MKTQTRWFWIRALMVVAFGWLAFALVAQETNSVPVTPLPKTPADYGELFIAFATPLAIFGMRKLVPKIPPWILPTSSPLVGMLIGLGVNALIAQNVSWIDAGKLGLLGVGLRESWNQVVTKHMASEPEKPASKA